MMAVRRDAGIGFHCSAVNQWKDSVGFKVIGISG